MAPRAPTTRPYPTNALLLLALETLAAFGFGCGGGKGGAPLALETFPWVRQPIAFAPPPEDWVRQLEGNGGTLGLRFVLKGGGGQCIIVAAFHGLAERDRRAGIDRLIARRGSLSEVQFINELTLVRPRYSDFVSGREAAMARGVNEALDRASLDYREGRMVFVATDLDDAMRRASGYEPTLEELLPRIRLKPELEDEPDRWRIGYERDTVIGGVRAFAGDDTLLAPGKPLLYREIFWVVRGCAFKATFQGTRQQLPAFRRVVDSIRFPEPGAASPK